VLQPVATAVLLGTVYGTLLGLDRATYVPGLLAAMILWQFVASSVTSGANSLIQAGPYILAHDRPIELYSLRSVLVAGWILLVNLVVCCTVIGLLRPASVVLPWIAIPLALPVGIAACWPLATLLALAAARWRDIPHLAGLAVQVMWFLTPILVDEQVFRSRGLGWLVNLNPAFHFIELVRVPLLSGNWPRLEDFGAVAAFGIVCMAASALLLRGCRRMVPLWL
jgi:ABC-type polysaccharide/polyol phosphate export permease